VDPPAPALHEDAGAPTPVAAWDALAAGTAPPPPAATRVEVPPPAAPERPPIRTGGPARWLWPVALLALGGGLIAAGYWITAPSD
jgi:hypothetical protein